VILLTGGTGFAGRHLALEFVAAGRQVRVLSRTPGRVILPDAVSWAQGDLTDPDSLREALCDVDTVVHAGAVLRDGLTPDIALERVNTGGTEALARVARDMGVRRFVHISSAGVYGDGRTASPHRESDTPVPGTPYERSKLSAEQALIATLEGSKVHWTILRPQGLYGPDRPATAAFFRMVAQKRFWLHGPAHVIVHPTHIADLTVAVRLVLDRNDLHHEVINIGGARSLEFQELISLIGVCVGRVPFQLSIPRWTRPLAALASQAWAAAGKPPALFARFSRAWVNRAVSIENARRLLGFAPVALEWGLDRTAAELRRQGLL
jgi:nucleoside-diphosphate-sugar epimerase